MNDPTSIKIRFKKIREKDPTNLILYKLKNKNTTFEVKFKNNLMNYKNRKSFK